MEPSTYVTKNRTPQAFCITVLLLGVWRPELMMYSANIKLSAEFVGHVCSAGVAMYSADGGYSFWQWAIDVKNGDGLPCLVFNKCLKGKKRPKVSYL